MSQNWMLHTTVYQQMNSSDFIQLYFKANDVANITQIVRLFQLSNMPMHCELILNIINNIDLTRYNILTEVLLKTQSTGSWCSVTGQAIPKILRQLDPEDEGTTFFGMLRTAYIMAQCTYLNIWDFSEIYFVWSHTKVNSGKHTVGCKKKFPYTTLRNLRTEWIWHTCLQHSVHQQPPRTPISAVQSCPIYKPARPTLWSRVTANLYSTSHTHTHYGWLLPTLTVPQKHRVQVVCNTHRLTQPC